MAEQENMEDLLDSMISGDYSTDKDFDDEDTDHEDDLEIDEDTETDTGEYEEDTESNDEYEDEENTLVEDDEDAELEKEIDELENDSNDLVNEDAEVDGNTDTDNTETEDISDVTDDGNTDEVDYREKYEELLSQSEEAREFYANVAGVKFKANGQEVEGFKDPKKIIQAQQMAYNYSDKMAGFKKYRPYMAPLKERGMLDDPKKFDLAMSLVDGDKEALKQHIKNLNIDPLDLDMEEINYTGETKRSGESLIAIEDAMEEAKASGVESEVYDAVVKEWDEESFKEFVDTPAVRQDLIQHMSDGTYETVLAKITQMSVLDTQYAGMKMTDKYRTAIQEINKETAVYTKSGELEPVVNTDRAAIEAEVRAQIEAEYKVKVDKKTTDSRKVDNARKKASSIGRGRPVSKSKAIDPMSFNGNEMSSFLDGMIMGK